MTTQTTTQKSSITQRLRTDLGRSVGVTHPTGVVKKHLIFILFVVDVFTESGVVKTLDLYSFCNWCIHRIWMLLSGWLKRSNFCSFITSLCFNSCTVAFLYSTWTSLGSLSVFSLMSSIISPHSQGWQVNALRSINVSSVPIGIILCSLFIWFTVKRIKESI